MFNETIVQHMLTNYGEEVTIQFCKMESDVQQLIINDLTEMKQADKLTLSEYEYERNWWAERAKTLKNNTNERIN